MEFSLVNIIIFVSIGVGVAGYLAFLFLPAIGSYGRTWERAAAGFLSLFMLAGIVLIGLGVGAGFVYLYDRFS